MQTEALKKTSKIINFLKCGLVLCIDASDMAIGIISKQESMMIAYESKELYNAEVN